MSPLPAGREAFALNALVMGSMGSVVLPLAVVNVAAVNKIVAQAAKIPAAIMLL
jgi:Na+-translocating ferredoxin:NAD+ oxidoreductase RnfE subunit